MQAFDCKKGRIGPQHYNWRLKISARKNGEFINGNATARDEPSSTGPDHN
jgi:hypothetical protein